MKQKSILLKIGGESLDNLLICQDKLLEFHKEPLISPIFLDVNKFLKEI